MLPLDVVARIFSFVQDMTLHEAVQQSDLALLQLLLVVDKTECDAALMDFAATRGDLAIVRALHLASPAGCTTSAMDGAAEGGHLDVVQFLHAHRTEGCTANAASQAMYMGHAHVMLFLIEHYPDRIASSVLLQAVWKKSSDVVEAFLHRFPDENKVIAKEGAATRSGLPLSTLKLLYELGTDNTPSRALVLSVQSKNLEFVQYLAEQGEGFVVEAMMLAVRLGYVDILAHLLDTRYTDLRSRVPSSWVDSAATLGHNAMVAFLQERCPTVECSAYVFGLVVGRGDAALVELLYRPNRSREAGIGLRVAATNGHFRVVQFLATHCNDDSIKVAAIAALTNGFLDIFDFLVGVLATREDNASSDLDEADYIKKARERTLALSRGSWSVYADFEVLDRTSVHRLRLIEMLDDVFRYGTNERSATVLAQAVARTDTDVINYLIERDLGDVHLAVIAAIHRGDLLVMRRLIESTSVTQKPLHDVNWMAEVARIGRLDMLTYLHENVPGLVCRPVAMDNAASLGHLEVVRFLHVHRTEGCTAKAMGGAVAGNHIDIVRFLHDNRSEGCSKRAFEKAAARGLTEMISLLLEIAPHACNVKKGIELAKAHNFANTVAILEEHLLHTEAWVHRDPATN